MQRREFVVASGSLLASGLASATALSAAGAPAAPLGSADFLPLLRQQFLLYQNRQGLSIELSALLPGPVHPGTDQFTLSFTLPPGSNVPEGTYEIEHPATGQLQLYLDQSGPDQLRASFNLLR